MLNGHRAAELSRLDPAFAEKEADKLVIVIAETKKQIRQFQDEESTKQCEVAILNSEREKTTDLKRVEILFDASEAANKAARLATAKLEALQRKLAADEGRLKTLLEEAHVRAFDEARLPIEQACREFNETLQTAYKKLHAVLDPGLQRCAELSASSNLPCPPHVYYNQPALDISAGRALKLMQAAPQVVYRNGRFEFTLTEVKTQ